MPWTSGRPQKVLPRHIRTDPRPHATRVFQDVSIENNSYSRKLKSSLYKAQNQHKHKSIFRRLVQLARCFISSRIFPEMFRLSLALIFVLLGFFQWSLLTAVFEMTCYCSLVVSHFLIVVLTFVSCITLFFYCFSPFFTFVKYAQNRWIFVCFSTAQFFLAWLLSTLVHFYPPPKLFSKLLTHSPKQGQLGHRGTLTRFKTRTTQLRFALGKLFSQNDLTAPELFCFLQYNEHHLTDFHTLCIGAYSAPART